jgi:hypothetical protein
MLSPEIRSQIQLELKDLSTFALELAKTIRLRDVRTGRWYTKVLTAYVAHYESQRLRNPSPEIPPEQRRAVAKLATERAAIWAACFGATAAAGVTAASIVTTDTGGLAGPLALPLSGVGMIAELLARSLIHLHLACRLAELYGMPFTPGMESELIRLYALAFRAEQHETEDDPGRGLVERVVRLQETGGLGKLIASGLIGETLLRNVVPFADVPLSSIRNWQLTHQVGRFVTDYVSRRVSLDTAVAALRQRSQAYVDLVVEGIWFIFISDGRLTQVETALLAHLMRGQSASKAVSMYFVSDEASWLERLQGIESDSRALFIQALEVAAGSDAVVAPSELTILQRAAATLGVPLSDAIVAAPQPSAADGDSAENADDAQDEDQLAGVGRFVSGTLRSVAHFALGQASRLSSRIAAA